MREDALTWSVLFYLFRHEGKGGKQLHHNFYDYLRHRSRRRESGIDIEVVHEVFDRFEQLDKGVIASTDVLDCLMCLHVTTMYMSKINRDHTERRMAKPANIAFAGGMGCRINHQMYNISRRLPTYQANHSFTEGGTSGESIQH